MTDKRAEIWWETVSRLVAEGVPESAAYYNADKYLEEFDKRFTEKPTPPLAITLRGRELSQNAIIAALGSADSIMGAVVNIVSGTGTREADALVRQAKEWLLKYS